MKKDVTGLAVERAAQTVKRVRELFQMRVPYGPTRVKMTPKEARRFWEKMSPEARLRYAQTMGIDEFMEMIGRLYGA